MKAKSFTTVDEYIATFPKETQQLLQQVRAAVKKAAPKAEERISYGMPGYQYKGVLVYFAGYEKHIGFYATPTGHHAFKKELSKYKQGKGSVQFPIDEKLPLALITKIVKFRVKENEEKAALKAKPKSAGVKKVKLTDAEQVTAYMNKLKHPLAKEAEALRAIIKKSGSKLSERIKWNAPSYYYQEDLFTFNFGDPKAIRLIFHHPSVVKIMSPLLEGTYKDRRIVYLCSMPDIKKKQKELERIIKEQLKLV